MSTGGNFFETERKAFKLREKDVNTTYTVRVGGASDNFIVDRVVTITDPTANFTITMPNGKYRGQRLLVALASNTNNKTVSVDKGSGLPYKLRSNGNYVSFEWVDAGTKGWFAAHDFSTF